jgi:hypothetical protein
MNTILVRSLAAMVADKKRRRVRQFLLGLSGGELQYLASFLGACILESEQPYQWNRAQLTAGIERFDQTQTCADREHKMLLLHEFLSRCNTGAAPETTARAT